VNVPRSNLPKIPTSTSGGQESKGELPSAGGVSYAGRSSRVGRWSNAREARSVISSLPLDGDSSEWPELDEELDSWDEHEYSRGTRRIPLGHERYKGQCTTNNRDVDRRSGR
jgi:hypothetical protein